MEGGRVQAISYVRAGDTLVVWKLDRLGRSLKDLITRITELNDRRIGFKSLTEQIDTTTSGGKLIFHIFGALAEFERDIIKERTNAGPERFQPDWKRFNSNFASNFIDLTSLRYFQSA
jgi:DNA invertase Pin-like site-specific DNA recombinase